MVICLERGADLHMAQLMPLPLSVSSFSKIQLVLPFWYRLTRVVLDKELLNRCVCFHDICDPGDSAPFYCSFRTILVTVQDLCKVQHKVEM